MNVIRYRLPVYNSIHVRRCIYIYIYIRLYVCMRYMHILYLYKCKNILNTYIHTVINTQYVYVYIYIQMHMRSHVIYNIYIYIYIYITKASLLAGVSFPLGMYWGQSFWRRSDLSHRNVPFKWFNHLILTPPPRRVQLPVGPWSSELFWITVSWACA